MDISIYDIWKELNQLDLEDLETLEEAQFDPTTLETHRNKHKRQFNFKDANEYNEFTHWLTSHTAGPIGSASRVIGYTNQSGAHVKFGYHENGKWIIGVYRGDAIEGEAVTCFVKALDIIFKDADPYRLYKKSIKQGDYRYKCDLDGDFKGLKFFDEHPEYHKNTSNERIEEIRKKILNKEKLGNFNTDRE